MELPGVEAADSRFSSPALRAHNVLSGGRTGAMKPTSVWHFDGDDLIVVSRTPPLPSALAEPINSLRDELGNTRQVMEDFLEVWREHKYRNDPEDALVGDQCSVHFVGDRVHLYPLYDEQWGDLEDAWIPLADVEEMFAAYAAWAFGGA